MEKANSLFVTKIFFLLLFVIFSSQSFAQQQSTPSESKSDFWNHVQFGGGIGMNFGSGYTEIMVSPSAIYNFNSFFAAGTSLQFGYINSKNNYESFTYGGSIIGLANPIEEIQLSAELEQLRFNTEYKNIFNVNRNYSENFWDTALYLGAGYRTENVTIGFRYDVFHDKKSLYSEAFMPFVRIYF